MRMLNQRLLGLTAVAILSTMIVSAILINAIDPGWVATDMGGSGGRPVEEGARGIIWAATLLDNGPSGGFFYDGKPVPLVNFYTSYLNLVL
jgi:hypothetical protein